MYQPINMLIRVDLQTILPVDTKICIDVGGFENEPLENIRFWDVPIFELA